MNPFSKVANDPPVISRPATWRNPTKYMGSFVKPHAPYTDSKVFSMEVQPTLGTRCQIRPRLTSVPTAYTDDSFTNQRPRICPGIAASTRDQSCPS
jgi:hypothetical protein